MIIYASSNVKKISIDLGADLCGVASIDWFYDAPKGYNPGDVLPSRKHTCIDMGAEEFVEGRLHPMIDFSIRNRRILQEARDPDTAVILIDVELGFGSNPDPAGSLVPIILEAKTLAQKEGRYLPVVASVVGTEGDFQDLAKQERNLKEVGVQVIPTSGPQSFQLLSHLGEMWIH